MMKNKAFTLIGAGVAVTAALSVTACSSSSHHADASASNAPMSAGSMTSAGAMMPSSGMMSPSGMMSGAFMGLSGKKVSGHASINGSTITLSDFSSDQGPDLHLYLTNGTAENDVRSGVEIGKVSYDTASQSFTVPANVNAASYKYLVVHCDKALAVFGAARLTR